MSTEWGGDDRRDPLGLAAIGKAIVVGILTVISVVGILLYLVVGIALVAGALLFAYA